MDPTDIFFVSVVNSFVYYQTRILKQLEGLLLQAVSISSHSSRNVVLLTHTFDHEYNAEVCMSEKYEILGSKIPLPFFVCHKLHF